LPLPLPNWPLFARRFITAAPSFTATLRRLSCSSTSQLAWTWAWSSLRAHPVATPPMTLTCLKLKSFGVVHLFADKEVLAPDFIGRVVAGIQAARPWVEFLNGALVNDEGGSI
jgi:hypothetical protein